LSPAAIAISQTVIEKKERDNLFTELQSLFGTKPKHLHFESFTTRGMVSCWLFIRNISSLQRSFLVVLFSVQIALMWRKQAETYMPVDSEIAGKRFRFATLCRGWFVSITFGARPAGRLGDSKESRDAFFHSLHHQFSSLTYK
jgi:hypothetical protein